MHQTVVTLWHHALASWPDSLLTALQSSPKLSGCFAYLALHSDWKRTSTLCSCQRRKETWLLSYLYQFSRWSHSSVFVSPFPYVETNSQNAWHIVSRVRPCIALRFFLLCYHMHSMLHTTRPRLESKNCTQSALSYAIDRTLETHTISAPSKTHFCNFRAETQCWFPRWLAHWTSASLRWAPLLACTVAATIDF